MQPLDFKAQPLDLADFIWQHKLTKKSYIIMTITNFRSERVIVYRDARDRRLIHVEDFGSFCANHEATYQIR